MQCPLGIRMGLYVPLPASEPKESYAKLAVKRTLRGLLRLVIGPVG